MAFIQNLILDTKVTLNDCPSSTDFITFLDAFVTAYYEHDQYKISTTDPDTTINIPLKLVHMAPENRLSMFKSIVLDQYFCEKHLDNHKRDPIVDPDFIINHRFLRQFNKRFHRPNLAFDVIYWIITTLFYIIWRVVVLLIVCIANLISIIFGSHIEDRRERYRLRENEQ